jgi:hypothetical protein
MPNAECRIFLYSAFSTQRSDFLPYSSIFFPRLSRVK